MDIHRITEVSFQLQDWDKPLNLDFSDGNISVIAGLNESGKTLLLQSIYRLFETIRKSQTSPTLSTNSFINWIKNTPITKLKVCCENTFEVFTYDDPHEIQKPILFSSDFIEEWISEDKAGLQSHLYSCGIIDAVMNLYESYFSAELVAKQRVRINIEKDEENVVSSNYNFGIEISEKIEIDIGKEDVGNDTGQHFTFNEECIYETINFEEPRPLFAIYPLQSFPSKRQLEWNNYSKSYKEEENLKLFNSYFSITEKMGSIVSEMRLPICHLIDTNRELQRSPTDFISKNLQSFIEFELTNSISKKLESVIREKKKLRDIWDQTGITNSHFKEILSKILPSRIFKSSLKQIQKTRKDLDKSFEDAFSVIKKKRKKNDALINNQIFAALIENFGLGILLSSMLIIASDGKVILNEGDEYHSSGQRNLLSMFSQILNALSNDSLILIDEPEISLHIEWQRDLITMIKKFIGQTSDLGAGNNIHLLITTHSPDIILHHPELVYSIPPKLEE